MKTKEIQVYSEESNLAVVRMPSRRFPGSVIQGDSLSILYDLAVSLYQRALKIGDDELIDEAEELKDLLEERIRHYETVLQRHDMELPYTRREKL